MIVLEDLQEKYGIEEMTVEALESAGDQENEFYEDFDKIPSTVLHRNGLLEWAMINTPWIGVSERRQRAIKRYKGKKYSERIETARLMACRRNFSSEYDLVMSYKDFLDKYDKFNFGPDAFVGCRSVEEIETRLDLYSRLSKNNLDDFFDRKFAEIMKLGKYSIKARFGFWEHYGGYCLSVWDEKDMLMHVSGFLDKKTRILTIHGAKEGSEGILNEFRETMGIHPGNFNLLLYLHLSKNLKHENVEILSHASRAFNGRKKNSKLYNIPKFYFRLRANPETGFYEFDAAKRDTLLDKFRKKHEVLDEVCYQIDELIFD